MEIVEGKVVVVVVVVVVVISISIDVPLTVHSAHAQWSFGYVG